MAFFRIIFIFVSLIVCSLLSTSYADDTTVSASTGGVQGAVQSVVGTATEAVSTGVNTCTSGLSGLVKSIQ
ncbi:hypothetical protein J6590_003748 [Homalodisca vitripennis]|nr:hypothetical protein J6590_003748 [Homalodisca vitripennis]